MKRIFLSAVLLLCCSLAACGSAGSPSTKAGVSAVPAVADASSASQTGGKVYEIKLHHDLAEESAQHQGLLEFKKTVEEKSGGRIRIQIFPNNMLGTDTEVAEMLQTGSVEAALIPTAKLSGFYAPLQVLDLPFIFPNREVCYETLDNEKFKETLFKPMQKIGFKGIDFWESGFKQFTANKELHGPDDFKGLKFRTMESPLIIAQFQALGASSIPIDFGETYNSLQQGVVDGEENPLVSIVNMKFYEVQKNCIISNHAYLAYAFLFSSQFWDTLPADLQKICTDAANDAVKSERKMTVDKESVYIQKISDSKCKVTYLSDEEKETLTKAMKPVHEQFRDAIGSDVLDMTYGIIKESTK
jgi:tripartite ATP-independent transporter DctP family solute receptor